jgi:hypothetical protein
MSAGSYTVIAFGILVTQLSHILYCILLRERDANGVKRSSFVNLMQINSYFRLFSKYGLNV